MSVAKNGRQIGNSNENDVCRLLSVWYGGETWRDAKVRDLPFRRRPTIITPIEAGHWVRKGDVMHNPNIPFPFSVEAKKDEDVKLEGVLTTQDTWRGWDHWEQALDQTQRDPVAVEPLMFLKRNRYPMYAVITEKTWLCLQTPQTRNAPHIRAVPPGKARESVVILPADTLLQIPYTRTHRLLR